jgi:iron complex transport system substrate-binding protein
MLDREIKVPQNIQRIVAIKPGALRILSYLDASDRIVGVEDFEKENTNPYNFANPQYLNLPVIGPQHGGDAELITLVKPDIIFMTYTSVSEADKLQNKTGIPVVALQYGDLGQNKETFFQALQLTAKLIGKTERADSLIQFITNTITDLNHRTKGISEKTNHNVYVGGISMRGAHGITSTTPDFAPFEFINVKNPARDFTSLNNNIAIDCEQLIEWNPQKIFIDYAGWDIVQQELKSEALGQSLDAVKNNEIYLLLPYNQYTTNFATILINSYYAGTVLFPDAFLDIDLKTKANSIYKTFLQKPVYTEMLKTNGSPKQVIFKDNK